MMNTKIRTYDELISFKSFEDRFNYLKLDGTVGLETFGFDRIFNQRFYSSKEWKQTRNSIIVRDCGSDLGILDREIPNGVTILIHHMNPIDMDDLKYNSKYLLDPNFLITTIYNTHRAIHYSDKSMLILEPVERFKNDTCPWKK